MSIPAPQRALVFSGGGLKGAAFVGALRALQEAGGSFDMFGGTSAGSLVATMCGAGLSVHGMETLLQRVSMLPPRKLRDYNVRGLLSLLTLSMGRFTGVLHGNRLEAAIRVELEALGVRSFHDLHAPTFVVAVNALTGEELVCTNMDRCDLQHRCHTQKVSVAGALRASTAIPGVFEPKRLRSGIYIDGGVRSYLPVVTAAQLGATDILGLTFSGGTRTREQVLGSGIASVVGRTLDLLTFDQLEGDVALLQSQGTRPLILQLDVEEPPLFDLKRIPELIDAGYHAMRKLLDAQPELLDAFRDAEERTPV